MRELVKAMRSPSGDHAKCASFPRVRELLEICAVGANRADLKNPPILRIKAIRSPRGDLCDPT